MHSHFDFSECSRSILLVIVSVYSLWKRGSDRKKKWVKFKERLLFWLTSLLIWISEMSYFGCWGASLDGFLTFLESICDLFLDLLDPFKVFLESVHYYSSLLLIISQSLLQIENRGFGVLGFWGFGVFSFLFSITNSDSAFSSSEKRFICSGFMVW